MNWKSRSLRIVIIFLIVTFVGLLLSIQSHAITGKTKEAMSWKDAVIWGLGWVYLWAALSPIILFLGRRFPLERKRVFRNIGVHVIGSAVLTLIQITALCVIMWLNHFSVKKPFDVIYGFMRDRFSEGDFVVGILIYCLILSIGQALSFYRKYRERKMRATQLEARLTEAELETLKMQLHPTFLFNTLRSIARLVHRDVDLADKIIARLGDFLRLTLDAVGSREVPLQQELDFLKCYLEIQRIRFQSKLTIKIDTEPDVLDLLVPNLILQPIVESAFQYSTLAGSTQEDFSLEIKKNDSALQMLAKGTVHTDRKVEDNVELINTRHRLQQIYGASHRLEFNGKDNRSLEVLLEIPFHSNAMEKIQ